MLEKTIFECESCASQFDDQSCIRDCVDCAFEVCDGCQAEDDLCDDCSSKRDAIDEA